MRNKIAFVALRYHRVPREKQVDDIVRSRRPRQPGVERSAHSGQRCRLIGEKPNMIGGDCASFRGTEESRKLLCVTMRIAKLRRGRRMLVRRHPDHYGPPGPLIGQWRRRALELQVTRCLSNERD